MLTKGNQVGKVLSPDPRRYWTPEIERRTQERLRRLSCPIFVGHGDRHLLKELNFKLFFPEMLKSLGKPVQINVYPGMQHGIFYWYDKDRLPYIKSFFDDCNYMFKKYLATQPVPMDRSAIQAGARQPREYDIGALRLFWHDWCFCVSLYPGGD